LRRRDAPEHVRLIVIAESPPASACYFYDPTGRPTEHLLSALMKQLGVSCTSKEKGLRAFRDAGWVLVDATYQPVDDLSSNERNAIILRDYPLLRDDLASLTSDHSTPVIVIKVNVCRLLEPKLVRDGFHVLNCGIEPPFPSNGQQPRFHEKFAVILESWRSLGHGSAANSGTAATWQGNLNAGPS
jgi:hypothetical protein